MNFTHARKDFFGLIFFGGAFRCYLSLTYAKYEWEWNNSLRDANF
jgi:hypothetical protein